MTYRIMATVAAGALAASAGTALAGCGIESGSVRILSNDFAALHAIADWAEKCAGDGVEVTRNQTEEHKNIQVPALSTNPASYTVAVVATNSIVPLLNEDLVRPLDDLVAEHGQQLLDSQLIRVDGKIMAIAFMANGQHLWYRSDLLEKNGLEPPRSYDEMVEAAKVLRESGDVENPLALNLMPGWNLAAEFVNAYLGTGGEFFEPGGAGLAIENEDGIAALEAMKAASEYMSPDFVTYDSNAMKPLWDAGEVAMSVSWGSRAADQLEGSASPEIAETIRFAAAPTIGDGTIPAAALWWDGFTIAKNISDEDAEASFIAMMNGISPEMMQENMGAAVWLIDGYEPTPAAEGVIANLQGGSRPYPMVPFMGILHSALGDNLAEYMQGEETAEQALADVTQAYTTAAREAGYLN